MRSGGVVEEREFSISATEVQDFLRCRRQWDYQSFNRRSLQRRGGPKVELAIGSAIHEALALSALGGNPQEAIQKYWDDMDRKLQIDYAERVGSPMSPEERNRLKDSRALCEGLVNQYYNKYGWDNPIKPYRYIAPEVSFKVPIPGTEWIDEKTEIKYVGYLVGQIDGVSEDEQGGIWLVEHKTYSQKAQLRDLELDWQMRVYTWAAQQLFQTRIQGALYDGIAKRLPKAPKVLNSGKLSREMNDSLTYDAYMQAILALGQDPLDDYYAPFLHRLQAREQGLETNFHTRHRLHYNTKAIDAVGTTLTKVWHDMVKGDVYPNFPWTGCWDCWVSDLCHAEEQGDNVEYLIERDYTVGTYGTRTAQLELTPTSITSLDDLRRLVQDKKVG